MKIKSITTYLTVAGLLAVVTFVGLEQETFAQAASDPAHAAHVAAGQMGNQSDGQAVEAQMAGLRARIDQLESGTPQQSAQSNSGNMPMGGGNSARGRTMPGMNMTGDLTVADQFAELRVKMQRLEATVQQQSGSSSAAHSPSPRMAKSPSVGAMPMGGKPDMGSGKKPMQGGMAGMTGMDDTSQPGAEPAMGGGMAGMNEKMDNMMAMMGKAMGGMGGGAPDASASMAGGGGMAMMNEKMDNMMAMMGKTMGGMGGGGMAMDSMDKGEMGDGAAPAGEMAGGGMGDMGMMKGMAMKKKMGMKKMEKMMGMMGGMEEMNMPSGLPGFPGASHLYHVGAMGFFLDHPQHITLSTDQQKVLNQIKEQAVLDESSADRKVQEAEQQLWKLTAADQPDSAQIEAKVREVEKLRGDQRLGFIHAVGEAAGVLSEEQRMTLVGTAESATSAATTGAPDHQHNP